MYSYVNFAQGTTLALNLYCFLLYCFLLLFTLRNNVSHLYAKPNNIGGAIFLFCGILIFSLTSFVDADFFHYYETMSEYRNQVFVDQERGLEVFYQYLIYYINGDYFIFRLVVWGSSLLLVVFAARQFKVDVYHTLFILFVGFIMTFSYARATLAMAVFSVGVVVISVASEHNIKKQILPTIIGLIIIACSIYFHRSMLPMFIVSVCWVFMPWKKQITKHSLWLFPVFVAICTIVLDSVFKELFVFANAVDDETGMLDKAELYAEQESVVHNLNGYFRLFLHYSTFYLPLVLISNVFRSDVIIKNVEKRIIWLYQIAYLIYVIASSIVLLDFDSSVFFYRFLYVSFIPMSILITSMKDSGLLMRKQYLWIVAIFIISNLFQLFAAVYSMR